GTIDPRMSLPLSPGYRRQRVHNLRDMAAGHPGQTSTVYAPHVRTHRLIAGVRVMSAALTTVSLLMLGTSVARQPLVTLAIESAYLILAIVLFARAMRLPFVPRRWPVALLAVDLTVVLVLLAETHGAASPFFASALFVVWAATYLVG